MKYDTYLKNFFKSFDSAFIVFVLFSFLLGILLGICVISNNVEFEKDCFNFYKENNYVLDSCKKFTDKLEVSE